MTVQPSDQVQILNKQAGSIAAAYKSPAIEIEHLVLALLLDEQGALCTSLQWRQEQSSNACRFLLRKLNYRMLQHMFELVSTRLAERGISIRFASEVAPFLIAQCEPDRARLEAQQLDRIFHKLVADPLMEIMLLQPAKSGYDLEVAVDGEAIVVSVTNKL